MTCLCARRIDVRRVASCARGRAELARKSLAVVGVASRVEATMPQVESRTHEGREYSERNLGAHFSHRSHLPSRRGASCKNLSRARSSPSRFRPLRAITGSDKQHCGVLRTYREIFPRLPAFR